MRILFFIAAILLLAFFAFAVYLVAPSLSTPERIEYGRAAQSVEALLAHVPSDATEVAIIPSAAASYRSLQNHPVTSDRFRQLAEEQRMPGAWVIGRGPLILWRVDDKPFSIALRVDPLRSFLLRTFVRGVNVTGGVATVGPTGTGFTAPRETPAERAHLFVLRQDTISGVVLDDLIRVHTVLGGRADSGARFLEGPIALPESAIVAASLTTVPEIVTRIEEALPVEISRLLERGGMLALYQLNDERLLPRPRGVILVPAGEDRFAELQRRLEALSPELPFGIAGESRRQIEGVTVVRRESIGFTLEYTRRGSELLIAFDKSSIEKFLADRQRVFETGDGSVQWLIRMDPQQLAPALERIQSHAGVRALIPELARRADQWSEAMQWIDRSAEVLAVKRRRGDVETLDITISPPK